MQLLIDKIAIITGSSRGIGRAITLKYAENGATVVVNYTKEGKDIEEMISLLTSRNANFMVLQGNVGENTFVTQMVNEVKKKYGHIDILVNNAGITRDKPLMFMTEKDWDEVMNINIKSAYLCSKKVLSSMLKQKWGRIINISSMTAVFGQEGQCNYGASKAGLLGFTKSLARETAKQNILVNAVVAGLIDTMMTKRISKGIKKRMEELIPMGRMGKTEEIADTCLFLASEMSSYITGTTINVTGGGYM